MPLCPGSSARMVEGWIILLSMWQGTQLTLHSGGQACHPLRESGGCRTCLTGNIAWGLHATGTVLRSNCYRSTTHLGSTAGWRKGCFLSCDGSRHSVSPFPCATGSQWSMCTRRVARQLSASACYPHGGQNPRSWARLLTSAFVAQMSLAGSLCSS